MVPSRSQSNTARAAESGPSRPEVPVTVSDLRPAAPAVAPFAERILWGVVVVGLLMTGMHAALELTWRFRHAVPDALRPLFLMHFEQGFSSWLTVFLNGLVGVSSLVARLQTGRRGWSAVGALFLYLAIDDATMLHERIGWLVEARIGEGFAYRWVQVLGPLLAVAGFLSYFYLRREMAGAPVCRRRLFLAYAMMGAAIGLEVVERALNESGLTWRGVKVHHYTIPVEELFELLAPALILCCIVRLFEVGRLSGPVALAPVARAERAERAERAGEPAGDRPRA